jgi:hypothetical protein
MAACCSVSDKMSDLVTELAFGQVQGDLLVQFGDFWGNLGAVCGSAE